MNIVLYKLFFAASTVLLVMAISNVAAAFPSRGGSCTSCHSDPGGSLTASPNPLDIQLGSSELLTFSITSLGGSSTTAISVQGLENPVLNASIGAGGNNWTFRSGSGGMSYVSDFITSTGPYTLDLMIGSLATPGTYPIVVMYVGDGQIGTDSGFTLRVMMAALAGDYNKNGIVDAADYTVWRDNVGSGTSLPNDDTAGVGADDYERWKANFGQTTGTGVLTNATVPEPSSALLLLMLLLYKAGRCSGWRSRRGTGSDRLPSPNTTLLTSALRV